MEYTIESLGGVPLGRSGTGAAVTLGKQDYSYLEPKPVKEDKYKEYTTASDIDALTGKVAKVWEPDRAAAKQRLDDWYGLAIKLEKERKMGQTDAAEKTQKELSNKRFEIENMVADSDRYVQGWAAWEKDYQDKSILYSDEDVKAAEEWKALPYEERVKTGYNPPVKAANELNYSAFSMTNMKRNISDKANVAKTQIISGNQKVNTGEKYYFDADVRTAANNFTETILPGSKYDNWWNQKILEISNRNDGSQEEKLADDIVAYKGTPQGNELKRKFIADENYKMLKQSLGSQFKIITPYTPPATRGGGRGGAKPKGAVNWVSRTTGGVDSTGQVIPDRTVWNVEISDPESDRDESYSVSRKYIEELAKLPEYQWLQDVDGFEFLEDPAIKTSSNIQIKGQVRNVYNDPKKSGVDADRIIISLPNKAGVRNEIEIPLMGNVAKINERFKNMGIGTYQQELRKATKGAQPAKAVVPPTPQVGGTASPARAGMGTQAVKGGGTFTIEKDGKYYSIPYANQKEYQEKLKAAQAKGGKLIK